MFKGRQRRALKMYVSTFFWIVLLQTPLKGNVKLQFKSPQIPTKNLPCILRSYESEFLCYLKKYKHRIDAIRKEIEKKLFAHVFLRSENHVQCTLLLRDDATV